MSIAAPGGAIYSRGKAGGELSRSSSMRAMAPALVRRAGWLDAGEVMGEGRSIECSRGLGRRKMTAPQHCGRHGQNRAVMTRRPVRASPVQAKSLEGLRITREPSRHERTTLRCSSDQLQRDPSPARHRARRQACQHRAHHASSCPRATLIWQSLSGVSSLVPSLHLSTWFGLAWTEMRGLVSNSS
jgi:hypothetical protein